MQPRATSSASISRSRLQGINMKSTALALVGAATIACGLAVATSPVAHAYSNCSDAIAAGAAPIYAGQPGYSRKLDRDGDGVACETGGGSTYSGGFGASAPSPYGGVPYAPAPAAPAPVPASPAT